MTAGARPRLVVDASVVLKWQLDDEDHVAQALALRDAFLLRDEVTLEAPTLLVYELTNAIHVAARRARLADAVATQALANLLECEVALHAPQPERVLALARTHGLSGYDAAYVALAEQLRSELWTGDRRLHEAMREATSAVRWIGEYPLPA